MISLPSDLPVVETFHSVQGEGIHAGRGAFFLRLAGCRVGCPWCDTKHSWPSGVHPRRSLADLAAAAASAGSAGAAFVVITGGEPLEHELAPLCQALRQAAGLPLHLETSGVDPLSGAFDWITLSPKRHHPPTAQLLAACHELKVVIHEPEDLDFAESMAEAAGQARQARRSRVGPSAVAEDPQLLLQPGWGSERGRELALDHVRRHPAWRLSLQIHKWLEVR